MKPTDTPPEPTPGSRAARVCGLREGRYFEADDWVAEEIPVAFVYNGISHAVMLATPCDLEEFALGFSWTEGIIDRRDQVYDVELCTTDQGIEVRLEVASSCFARLKERRRSLAGRTGCGLCGTESLEQACRRPSRVAPQVRFSATAIERAMSALRAHQTLQRLTGATHAAAWCGIDGGIVRVREDIGRHNALDKLLGHLLHHGFDLGEGFVAVTSRASYEMVQKTAQAGIAMLAAISSVTSLAIEVARDADVTLVGFARGSDLNVYHQAARLQIGD